MSTAISSGHSKYVAGAIGLVEEVEQARKITDRLADLLDDVMTVHKFHDDTSRTQADNLSRIVSWHNKTDAKYHYSMHLNSSGSSTNNKLGVEVLYAYDVDKAHAIDLANAISKATGLKNRGAKKRNNLAFLCAKNRLLIEAYFVNSRVDVSKMDEEHEVNAFALAVAKTIASHQGITYKVTANKPCRVKSGAFKTWLAAENAKKALAENGIASAKYTKVYQDGPVYRYLTGTFASKTSADNAIVKMKKKEILGTAYTIEA